MIIINKGENTVLKLLRANRIDGQYYRLNNCVISEVTSGGLLLLNTITGEMVLSSNEERQELEFLPGPASSVLSKLIEHNYVVPLEYNEKSIINQLRLIIWKSLGDHYRSYVILPTTFCNARCFYCYESDFKHIHMKDETAADLVNFIETHRGGKDVSISWFGGEPLLGKKTISLICSEFKKRNVPFVSKMVSNGYLFDSQLINTASNLWNLKHVQITLDGTEELYNQTKAYVGVSGSAYKRVINNIKDLLNNNISVNIRLNLDKHNEHNLIELVNELDHEFDNKQLLSVYVSVLNENTGFNPLHHEEGEIKRLWKQVSELNKLLVAKQLKGKFNKLPGLKLNNCMADSNDQFVCSPDGILGKCEHYVDQFSVGSLAEGVNDISRLQWWKETYTIDECDNCPLISQCVNLKNCPVTKPICELYTVDTIINSYKQVMNTVYSAWTSTNN